MTNLTFLTIPTSLAALVLLAPAAYATTPAEMAELSLEEILSLPTDQFGLTSLDYAEPADPWQFSFLLSRQERRGYVNGSDRLGDSEVFFTPGSEPRTDRNFPILPTEISQDVALFTLSYTLDADSSITVSLPLISQSTDHLSIVSDYPVFTIDTQGIGDFTASYRLRLKHWDHQSFGVSVGLSAPSGSINEKGDTPRAPGDQQLPYTMQLGSGTWDFPLSMYYYNEQNADHWGLNLQAKVRTGKNSRDYRTGDRISLGGWWRGATTSRFQPIVKLGYHFSGRIHGQDKTLLVPGDFPYPAAITDPDNFGGKTVNLSLGILFSPKKTDKMRKYGLSFEVGKPLYQSLNGIQLKQHLQVSMQWHLNF